MAGANTLLYEQFTTVIMSRFQDAPTEISHAILSEVPTSSLNAVTATCRRLRHNTTPLLYESLYFWDSDHSYEWSGSCSSACLFCQSKPHGTRVIKLAALIRTLQSSIHLRSLIRDLDLRWWNYKQNHDDNVRLLLKLLESSQLKRLHLSPPDLNFQIPDKPSVTSLSYIHERHEAHRPFDDEAYTAELNQLHTWFRIPSLVSVHLDGWRCWHLRYIYYPTFGEESADSSYDQAGSSDIKYLTIDTTGTPGELLRRLLSWPKALESLVYTARPYDGLRYERSPNTEWELQKALLAQKDTLVSLTASGHNGNCKEIKVPNREQY